jgi:hypothetical protein
MRKVLSLGVLMLSSLAHASVGKVYDPYVNAYEDEVEYRLIVEDGISGDPRQRTKQIIGFATGIAEGIKAELAASHYEIEGGASEVRSSELEFFWQITEQGEYDSDWGAGFSIERNHVKNYWEASSKLFVAHDFGHSSLVLNTLLNYSWGSGIDNEYEAEVRGAYLWRYSAYLSPSIELHTAESLTAVGPMLGGKYRLMPGKALVWRTGLLFGLDTYTPKNILKFELELEF